MSDGLGWNVKTQGELEMERKKYENRAVPMWAVEQFIKIPFASADESDSIIGAYLLKIPEINGPKSTETEAGKPQE